MNSKLLLTLLAATALIASAVAMPVAAQGDGERPDRSDAEERRAEAEERRAERQAEREERAEERAERLKEVKAHRAEAVLGGAIHAHEHRLERLHEAYDRVNASLQDDNLTDNETAEREHKLERIEAAIERTEAKVAKFVDKRAAILERWGSDDVESKHGNHTHDGNMTDEEDAADAAQDQAEAEEGAAEEAAEQAEEEAEAQQEAEEDASEQSEEESSGESSDSSDSSDGNVTDEP